jgi:hypothetical protein
MTASASSYFNQLRQVMKGFKAEAKASGVTPLRARDIHKEIKVLSQNGYGQVAGVEARNPRVLHEPQKPGFGKPCPSVGCFLQVQLQDPHHESS